MSFASKVSGNETSNGVENFEHFFQRGYSDNVR